MKSYVKDRTLKAANHIINSKSTLRETSAFMGISKSTIHHDLTIKLEEIDKALHILVKEILQKNKNERTDRGGEATRKKHLSKTIAN